MTGLDSYPALRDSGLPWLGDAPEPWELQRTKTVLRERVEEGFPDEPLLAISQSKRVVLKEQYESRTAVDLKVRRRTRGIDRPLDDAQSEIALLHQDSTRLIADVVTGKLDVREAPARPPDELYQPELLDEAAAETDAEEATGDDLEAAPTETEA